MEEVDRGDVNFCKDEDDDSGRDLAEKKDHDGFRVRYFLFRKFVFMTEE